MVAAPILNECDDIDGMLAGFIFFSVAARPDLVRNLPSCQVKKGPDLDLWVEMYEDSALTGQRGELLLYKCMTAPCLKGSVLEALMRMDMWEVLIVTSWNARVDTGSYSRIFGEVYSDTRRKP